MRRSERRLLTLFALALAGAGCSMLRARDEVRAMRTQAFLAGGLDGPERLESMRVLLYRAEPGGAWRLEGLCALPQGSEYWSFRVGAGGGWAVAGWSDSDGDGAWSAGEPWGVSGLERPLRFAPGGRIEGLTLALDRAGAPPAALLHPGGVASARDCAVRVSRGEIVTLDDPRFAPEPASEGLWTPVAALGRSGAGVYFLEPYAPAKTPVLFVHGIGGSPRDLAALVAGLDRERFQPWLFHYPSGFPLRAVSAALRRTLVELRRELGFRQVDVVAHSMGGLIARDLVLRLQADPAQRDLVGYLVTLASPFGGHPAAKWGLRFAPEPVPAWVDMEPGSEFVRELERPWPRQVPHALLFGFRRGGNPLLPLSSDSVVPLASQLPDWAQASATLLHGFDTDHMEIVQQPKPVRFVLRLLEEAQDAAAAAPPR